MRAFHEIRDQAQPVQAFLSKNMQFRAHWQNEIEVVFVIRGVLTTGLNQSVYDLREGQVLIAGSGDIHYYAAGESAEAYILIVRPDTWMNVPHGTVLFRGGYFPQLPEAARQAVFSLARDMTYECGHRGEASDLMVEGMFLQLAAHLTRLESWKRGHTTSRGWGMEALRRALDYMEENAARPLSLAEVALVAGYSECYFSHYFGEVMGMGFSKYLMQLRVELAQELLRQGDLPVTEVAYASGFDSLRHFNRCFSGITGTSPARWRKSIRNG